MNTTDHLMKSLDDLIADSKTHKKVGGGQKGGNFLKKGIQKNKSYLGGEPQ